MNPNPPLPDSLVNAVGGWSRILLELAGSVPAAVAVVIVVYVFVNYIKSRDRLMNSHVDQIQRALDRNTEKFAINAKALGQAAAAIHEGARATEKACRALDRLHQRVENGDRKP